MEATTGLTKASTNFGTSFRGGGSGEINWAWANYEMPFMPGYGVSGYGGTFLSPESRQHALAAAVAVDLIQSDPVIAAIVEQLSTQALGEGLTLSLRLAAYAEALGMTPDEARTFANEIELAWRLYADDPREVDAHGTHNLASLAYAGFRSYLLQGELLAGFPYRASRDATFGSKVQLMTPAQIATDRTIRTDYGWVFEGVCYNKQARVDALEIRDQPLGDMVSVAIPKRVDLFTSWGRPRLAHIYDLIAPNSPRGMSPLAVALTPAKSKATIQELTLGSYALQNSYGAVITADMSPARAFQGLQVNDDLGGTRDPYVDAVDSRANFYGENGAGKVKLGVGKIVHLHPGDKLEMVQPRAAGQPYEQIDTSLLRLAASASGLSYDQLASDYSKTSFSAAKLASHLPYIINLRRRAAVAGRFYQAAFDCWLEEAVERQIVKWPAGAKDYWSVRKIVSTACVWRGPAKASADPLKDAEAAVKRVNAGLSTLTRECADLGEDFDSVVAERAAEIETLKRAGIWQITEAVDTVAKQEVDKVQEDVEDDARDLPDHQRDTLDELKEDEE